MWSFLGEAVRPLELLIDIIINITSGGGGDFIPSLDNHIKQKKDPIANP